MILNIFTINTLKFVAKRTTDYVYNDWVVPLVGLDRDGNSNATNYKKSPSSSWKQYSLWPPRGEALPTNACHRCEVTERCQKSPVTEYYVLAWVGSIIYVGAFFHGRDNWGGIVLRLVPHSFVIEWHKILPHSWFALVMRKSWTSRVPILSSRWTQ